MTKKLIARSFLHSCTIPRLGDSGNAVSVCEHLHYDDQSVVPNLRLIRNPQQTFYVTKKAIQGTHTEKKERELISNCDKIVAPNHDFFRVAHKALFGYAPKGDFANSRVVREKVLNSPYLYGAGADIQSLIKFKYRDDFEKTSAELAPITTGAFDTEISLVHGSEGQLICATLTHENKVFTSVNAHWMHRDTPDGKRKIPLSELSDLSRDILLPIIDELFDSNKDLKKLKHKLPFEFHYHEGVNEIEMIRWLFLQMHLCKTIFVGIWNLGYDIGQLLRICQEYNIDPASIFSHPDIPQEAQYFRYKEDRKRTAHLADKWHWVSAPAYSQFIDLMEIGRAHV